MSQQQHPQWEEELMPYADGQLPAERATKVAEHLESCHECAQAVADAKNLSLRMSGWQVEAAPDKMQDAVLAALSARKRRPEFRTALGWWARNRVLVYSLGGAVAGLFLLITLATPSLLRSRQAAPSAKIQLESLELEQSQKAELAPPPSGPMVIRTVRLSIITKEFDSARTRIEAVVRNAKGYVDNLTVRNEPGQAKGLSAAIRIPSDRLDASLVELRRLGISKEESQNSADVTSQYVDLEARLTNARNTEQRLLTMLRERTGNLKDVIEAEREVSRVRGEIEQMEAERKNLGNQVQYATVQLNLNEEYHAEVLPDAPSAGTRLRNAAVEGYQNATETLIGLGEAALAYGPMLLILSALLGPVAFLVWRLKRRLSY